MTEHLHDCDVAIIGAGPVGLFAVFEFGMLGMSAHVVDTLEISGGQCTALYPEKPIYDIPGFPRIAAAELIEQLRAQAAPFEPVYHLGQQVARLERIGAKGRHEHPKPDFKPSRITIRTSSGSYSMRPGARPR